MKSLKWCLQFNVVLHGQIVLWLRHLYVMHIAWLQTQHTHTLAHTFLKEFIESEFILNHDQFTILHCIDIWAGSVCNGVTNHVFLNAVIHYWNWHKLNKIMYILYHFEGFHWLRTFSFRSYSISFTRHWIFGVNITRIEIYLFFLHSHRIHLLTTIYGEREREKKTEYKTHTYATWIEGTKNHQLLSSISKWKLCTQFRGDAFVSLLFHSKLTNRKCFCCSSIRFYFCLLFFLRLSHWSLFAIFIDPMSFSICFTLFVML